MSFSAYHLNRTYLQAAQDMSDGITLKSISTIVVGVLTLICNVLMLWQNERIAQGFKQSSHNDSPQDPLLARSPHIITSIGHSERQFKRKIQAWGLRKYANAEDYAHLEASLQNGLEPVEKLELTAPRVPINERKLKRFRKRHNQGTSQATLPRLLLDKSSLASNVRQQRPNLRLQIPIDVSQNDIDAISPFVSWEPSVRGPPRSSNPPIPKLCTDTDQRPNPAPQAANAESTYAGSGSTSDLAAGIVGELEGMLGPFADMEKLKKENEGLKRQQALEMYDLRKQITALAVRLQSIEAVPFGTASAASAALTTIGSAPAETQLSSTPHDDTNSVFTCRHCCCKSPIAEHLSQNTKGKHEKPRHPCSTLEYNDYRRKMSVKLHELNQQRGPHIAVASISDQPPLATVQCDCPVLGSLHSEANPFEASFAEELDINRMRQDASLGRRFGQHPRNALTSDTAFV
ncbi:uncharacterized protein PG986_005965 [Apiospora aurea]|uniref:Clr5 domain-containing protein n=1 Tax=Apiospora aurea TaxID=335848 RepID=A0ABR1QJE3_9PEZI